MAGGQSGQATVESAWLAGALVLGTAGLGWPLVRWLVEAFWAHREAVLLPVRLLWP